MDIRPRRFRIALWLATLALQTSLLRPQTAEQLFRQAAAQAQSMRMAEAELLLQKALEKEPDHLAASGLLGRLYLMRGAAQAALECYNTALHYHPRDPEALYGRSLALGSLGQPALAASELEKLLPEGGASADLRLTWITFLFLQGSEDKAFQEAQNLARQQPRDAEVFRLLGLLWLSRGDSWNAYRCLKKSADLNPRHTLTLLSLSSLAGQHGDGEESKAWAERALALDRFYPLAWDRLAQAIDRLGQAEEAAEIRRKAEAYRHAEILYSQSLAARRDGRTPEQEKLLRQCLDSNPELIKARLDLGDLLLRQGSQAAAREIYRKILQQDPDHLQARQKLAALLLSAGQVEPALEEYRKAVALAPFAPEIHAAMASAYLQQRSLKKARDSALQAAALQPEDPDLLSFAGDVLFAAGSPQKASQFYARALQGNPALAEAELGLARAFRRMKNWDQAAEALRRITDRSPEMQDAWTERILLSQEALRPAEAEEAARQCLRKIPASTACRESLASLLLRSGGYQESARLYQELLAASPKSKGALDGLGYAYSRLGKYREAEQELARSLAIHGDDPWVLRRLGFCRKMQQNLSGSAQAYRRAAERAPEDDEVLHDFGLALLLNREYPEAIRVFQKVLERKPQSGEACLNLALGLWHTGDFTGALAQARNARRLGAAGAEPLVARLELYLGGNRKR